MTLSPSLLVVDDCSINLRLLKRQLDILGVQAMFCDSPKEALDWYRQHRPTTLLTDCLMPEMDGFALTRAIRQHEQSQGWPPCQIIGLTGDTSLKSRCLEAGMDSMLEKPLSLNALEALFK